MIVTPPEANEMLAACRTGRIPLYLLGIFDEAVTVLSQQVRALNLAWSLVESGTLPCQIPDETGSAPTPPPRRMKVAIVGAGFTGLTLAAGLLRKQVLADITIFEKRDALLPLQHGSDTRWLHPRIYNWPAEGSQASAAMLPVLNWTAGRASDVVVQVLNSWKQLIDENKSSATSVDLFCNSRHLQITELPTIEDSLNIEWVGEAREPSDGADQQNGDFGPRGRSAKFDLVILAIGFGLERDNQLSYWRNDFIAQPSLDEHRQVYVVSGQGDGAMIDLLRASISHFRQDRILYELFGENKDLLTRIRLVSEKFDKRRRFDTFAALESLFDKDSPNEFTPILGNLRRRIRRDTDVILHLKLRTLSDLFQKDKTRISFQNRVLVYMLYKCGGFVPTFADEQEMISAYNLPDGRVVRRHGTFRDEQLGLVLSKSLTKAVKAKRGTARPDPYAQTDRILWTGGYFGKPGRTDAARNADDKTKGEWRKEYLPGATQLLASTFCETIAGYLSTKHSPDHRLRVTLHRAMNFGKEEFLQQCCEYAGLKLTDENISSSAGRTFAVNKATIGLAYRHMRIIRSIKGVSSLALDESMNSLALNFQSRTMSKEVSFICAIPLMEPASTYTLPSPVAGVIYIDSEKPGWFLDNSEVEVLRSMAQTFLNNIVNISDKIDRISNVITEKINANNGVHRLGSVDLSTENKKVHSALEIVPLEPPFATKAFQINLDYSDFRVN